MTHEEAGKELARIALSQVGVKEEGGNNRGKMVREYQGATWLDPDAWPWCAAFVDWCVREWLKNPEVRAVLKVDKAEQWRPKTAGAWDLARWARSRQVEILGEAAAANAGDIVIYDFSHVGIVVEDSASRNKTLVVVEGNTNGKGERDSVSGDGVWRKVRARTLAKSFLRVAGDRRVS